MEQHPNVPQPHPLRFKNLLRGSGGPQQAVNDVIDDRDELEEYAASCTSEGDRDAVLGSKPRFDREKVIAVALGERPTAGYEVEVVAVVQITGGFVGLQTVISYVERRPGGPAATVITYPHHVIRVKNAAGVIIFRRVPDVTTLAIGEESPPQPQPPDPRPTTLAVGEEDPRPTTLAVGEEDPRPTTLMLGEEDPRPTTMMVGEEQPPTSWFPFGEQPPTTMWSPWEEGATTMMLGEEGPPSDPRLEDPFGSGGGGGRGPFGGF